jgi:fatty acid desaturase
MVAKRSSVAELSPAKRAKGFESMAISPQRMALETFGCRPAAKSLLDPSAVRSADPANGKQSVYLGLDTTLPDITEERRREIKEKFPHFPVIYDQQACRRECLVRLPRWTEDWANRHLISDARDTIMLSTISNMIMSTGFLSTMLFLYPSHLLGICVVLFNAGMWVQRFILMMHYAEHKPLFKPASMRLLMPWVMAPFYGIPIGMYKTHHIRMHHKENNMNARDLSSTEPYQRDSLLHWLHYYAMFWALLITLPIWTLRYRSLQIFAEVFAGELMYFGGITALYLNGYEMYVLYQFMVPFCVTSLALMFGNWSQHIFVCPSVSTSKAQTSSHEYNCKLALNVVNHFDNQVAFNDGYHITHHIHPACHWTEMPIKFLNELEKYAEHDPVMFDCSGFFDIGLNFLIRKQFDPDGAWKWAYEHFIHLTKEKRSFEEVKAFLEERLKPCPERTMKRAAK